MRLDSVRQVRIHHSCLLHRRKINTRTPTHTHLNNTGTEIMALHQPGGYYELIKSVYSTDAQDCGTHSECCGFNDAQGNFVRTVPFDEDLGGNLGGSGDKMEIVKDIFSDPTCQAKFKCGPTGANVVSATCGLYDVSFNSYH